jgi:acyl-CoA synthetase (AMP-forming)/AMP-acid ligase II
MPSKLLQQLARHARTAGTRLAYREVAEHPRELTYAALDDAAHAFAASLSQRIAPGAAVMLCLPNVIEFPVAFLGTLAAGCDAFPVSPELTDAELTSLAAEAGAAAVIGQDRACNRLAASAIAVRTAEVLSPAAAAPPTGPPTAAGDLLLASSGTTGRPKIVRRTAASLDAVSANMVAGVGFTESDVVLSAVPLCHSYGLEHGLLAPLWAGAGVRLRAGFDIAAVLHELAHSAVSIFPSVPAVYDMMSRTADPYSFPSLRKAYAAGAPLPAPVADAFESRFGVRLSQLYGMTEVGSVAYADPDAPNFDRAGVGRPFDGVDVRIVDPDTRAPLPTGNPGELLIRATSMFRGYVGEPTPATVDGGFFPTGDLGKLDDAGNLTITGRLKLLVEVGGHKVNLTEVEAALLKHPAVAEAVVVAMRVNQTVSRLRAVITARAADRPPVPEELRAFLRERLPGYKIPRVIDVVDRLPRSPAGKILRSDLEQS